MRAGGEPERAWCELVTGDFFCLLGVPAQLGRVLVPDDDGAPGTGAVAVLSDDYWRRRFAADPGVIGKTLAVNGRPFTIVGVAAKGFHGGTAAFALDLWVPMSMQAAVTPGDRLTNRGNGWLQVLLRLAPGETVRQAQAGFSVVMARLAKVSDGITPTTASRSIRSGATRGRPRLSWPPC